MRRNPDYFGGKLCLIYRTNVMNWIREEMNRFKDDDDTDLEFGRKPRMYYQYKTLDQIEKRIKSGDLISGFTLAGDNGNYCHIWHQAKIGIDELYQHISFGS